MRKFVKIFVLLRLNERELYLKYRRIKVRIELKDTVPVIRWCGEII